MSMRSSTPNIPNKWVSLGSGISGHRMMVFGKSMVYRFGLVTYLTLLNRMSVTGSWSLWDPGFHCYPVSSLGCPSSIERIYIKFKRWITWFLKRTGVFQWENRLTCHTFIKFQYGRGTNSNWTLVKFPMETMMGENQIRNQDPTISVMMTILFQ